MNFFRMTVYIFVGLFLVVTGAIAAEPKSNFITIGTGSRNGVYYPVGRAISTQVNQLRDRHGLRCSVESTHGSVYNLNTLRLGEFELCISQSDQIVAAYNGESSFSKQGTFKELRTLCSLYMEPLTVVTRKGEADISYANLKKKQIFIGQLDSGHRATVISIIKQIGWNLSDIHEPEAKLRMTSPLALQALCKHEIDAVMLVVGHPYQPLVKAATTCDLEIMAVSGPKIDNIIKNQPAYYDAVIPGSLYTGNPEPVKTLGVVATLVSSSTVDDEIIYQVVKSLFEQLDQFKKAHPRLNALTREGMVNQGLAVPLHDGAKRYYVEAGLIAAGHAGHD